MKGLVAALVASVALVGGYLALGGGGYEPTPPPSACDRRTPPPAPEGGDQGVDATLERLALTTLAGAACDLGVSRERLLLALAGEQDLGIDTERRDDAFRAGLEQAIEQEERAGRLGGTQAFLLRQAIGFLPIDALLDRLFPDGL